MITGAHSIIYSTDPEADRAFFRDVLNLTNVDAGDGWLIFGLPPAEIAVHPSEKNDVHELYLMCDDIDSFATEVKKRGVQCSTILDQGWGLLAHVTLPGGGRLGVYQPRHPRPDIAAIRRPQGKPARRTRKSGAVHTGKTSRVRKKRRS